MRIVRSLQDSSGALQGALLKTSIQVFGHAKSVIENIESIGMRCG